MIRKILFAAITLTAAGYAFGLLDTGVDEEYDSVDLASRDSFPASDPPAWIN